MYPAIIRNKAHSLRLQGKTYSEINSLLGLHLPKGTLSGWCRGTKVPEDYEEKVRELNRLNLFKAREASIQLKLKRRKDFFHNIEKENKSLFKLCLKNTDVHKIILAILYLAEGSKTKRSLCFGNSDPMIINLFVNLMRKCYKIDESKFRCTIQCRADQDIPELELFWSEITSIPLKKFYKARIDSRSIGKPTLKKEYKGVCKIDYFSSAIDLELKHIAKLIMTKGL